MTRTDELTQLRQEVAELWRRFRKEEPSAPSRDPERASLMATLKAFDVKQKELMTRRDALRAEQELERARASSVVPVLRGLGLVVGVAAGAALALGVVEDVAAWTTGLTPAWGAVLLFSVVPFPLLLPKFRR